MDYLLVTIANKKPITEVGMIIYIIKLSLSFVESGRRVVHALTIRSVCLHMESKNLDAAKIISIYIKLNHAILFSTTTIANMVTDAIILMELPRALKTENNYKIEIRVKINF